MLFTRASAIATSTMRIHVFLAINTAFAMTMLFMIEIMKAIGLVK